MQGLAGYAFAGEGEVGVILDTNITPELKEEGDVRELISKIQNLRKEQGFQVADRIELFVAGSELLLPIIRKYEEHLKKETLAEAVHYGEEFAYEEFNINGESLNMGVRVLN
jgi:isoleucyl-tRNA synthetase